MTILKIGTEIEWSSKISSSTYTSFWEKKYDVSIKGKYDENEFITKTDSLPEIDTLHPKLGIDTACNQFKTLLQCQSQIDLNSSQGLHIHVSGFKKKSVIFSKEFHDYFISEYQKMCKTPEELQRLSTTEKRQTQWGLRPNYCRAIYDSTDRRRAINYIHSWRDNNRKTIEFRLFASTKSVSDYRRYLTFLIRCISKFENKKIPEDTFIAEDDITDDPSEIILKETCL